MKTYMKPVLEVREIRVSENIAANQNLWDNAVWTKYNMLNDVNSSMKVSQIQDLKFAE